MKKSVVTFVLAVAVTCGAWADTVADQLVKSGNFKTLIAAIESVGLMDLLRAKGPITVFAPNDAAFAKIPKAAFDDLYRNKSALTQLIVLHVVEANLKINDLKPGAYPTIAKQDIVFSNLTGPMVGSAKLVSPDMIASNGVVHVIDTVLLPSK
jgi:uncharacterized surface protein with fasciclin (FAS1) repeats